MSELKTVEVDGVKYVTTGSISKVLQVAPYVVQKWCDTGVLDHIRHGKGKGRRLVSLPEFEKFQVQFYEKNKVEEIDVSTDTTKG